MLILFQVLLSIILAYISTFIEFFSILGLLGTSLGASGTCYCQNRLPLYFPLIPTCFRDRICYSFVQHQTTLIQWLCLITTKTFSICVMAALNYESNFWKDRYPPSWFLMAINWYTSKTSSSFCYTYCYFFPALQSILWLPFVWKSFCMRKLYCIQPLHPSYSTFLQMRKGVLRVLCTDSGLEIQHTHLSTEFGPKNPPVCLRSSWKRRHLHVTVPFDLYTAGTF